MQRIRDWVRRMGREYPGSSAVALWVALAVVGTVHLWARPAYAHFSSCDTVFSCSGGILDFATGQQVPLEHGGTEADLSATGGAGQYVKQESSGGAMTVGVIPAGDLPSAIDAANIADGSVSDAEYQRLDGATADIQGQIDARLSVAGGTMTGQLVLDDLMLSFTESDTAQTCGAGDYGIYADLSETKFKKCENGTTTDLDTSGSVTVPKYVQTTDMDLADTDTIFFSIASGMLCATESDCKTSTQQGTTIDNVSARANKDIGGTNNTVEIACGSCTTSIATDCQSGDACVTVASTSSDTPTAADTDGVTWTAGQCCVGEIVASGNTNAGVLYVVSWTETGS